MSAVSISLWRIFRPSSDFRFKVTLLTPLLLVSKKELISPRSSPAVLEPSPTPGTSTLITSAPRSAIIIYGTVPACAVEHVTALTPLNGPALSAISISFANVFPNAILQTDL